jgi:hypothetical protein
MFKNFNVKHAGLILLAVISGAIGVYSAVTGHALPASGAAAVSTITSVLSLFTASPASSSGSSL